MANDEAQKLNNTYMRIDYSLFASSNDGKPLTKSAILLGGFIGTFSKEDKFGNVVKRCWAKYSRFENALGLSSATIWRSKSELSDYIKCVGQSQYVLRDEKTSNRHLRLPYYFLNETFNIEGRDRKLSRSELAVLMLLYSECCLYDNDVYHYEEVSTTYKKIGKDLNLNEKTVRKAINVLQDLKIIWRTTCAMPGMHTFGLKTKMFSKLERHFKKAAKNEVKTSAPSSSDGMIDRERYYSDQRAKAEMVADKAKDRALRYMPFYNADKEVKKLGIELAFAEVRTPEKKPELDEQLKAAERKRLVALTALGLTDDDLMPHYTCSKCNDTGWLPNGKPCNCYPRE